MNLQYSCAFCLRFLTQSFSDLTGEFFIERSCKTDGCWETRAGHAILKVLTPCTVWTIRYFQARYFQSLYSVGLPEAGTSEQESFLRDGHLLDQLLQISRAYWFGTHGEDENNERPGKFL